jgi:hypothetical protein
MGTGVTLDTSSVVRDTTISPALCDDATSIKSKPSLFAPNHINIYLLAGSTWFYAKNCHLEGHSDIVFLNWTNESTPERALAHELAHALGLTLPSVADGHTNFFYDPSPPTLPGNLMESGFEGVPSMSVGQRYAFHFSKRSWINRDGSTIARPFVRDCQDSWTDGVCASLSQMAPGWPKP